MSVLNDVSYPLRWIAIHRHDLRVEDREGWQRFEGILHNGFRRQLNILNRHLRVMPTPVFMVSYVYPYALYDAKNLKAGDFANWGNLLDDFAQDRIPHIHESKPSLRPTPQRIGYWVDWTKVEIPLILSRARSALTPDVRRYLKFWFVDNIPDWYSALRRVGSECEFSSQVSAMFRLLRQIHDVPVIGNVYQGGVWLGDFLKVADGAFFEDWQWHWTNGAVLLDERTRQSIARNIALTLEKRKHLWLNVPFLTDPMTAHFRREARAILEKARQVPVMFGEHQNFSKAPTHIPPSTVRTV